MSTPPNQNPGQPQWGGPQPNQPEQPFGQSSANAPFGQQGAPGDGQQPNPGYGQQANSSSVPQGGQGYGQGSANPPAGQSSANPPYGQSSANPPYGQGSANPPYGQGSANPPYGQGSANPPAGQSSANPPYGQTSANPPASQPGAERAGYGPAASYGSTPGYGQGAGGYGPGSANQAGYAAASYGQTPNYGGPGSAPVAPPVPGANYTAQGFDTTPKPNAARNKKIILIIAGVLVLALVAVIGMAAWNSNQNSKNSAAALTAVLSALKSGDAETALSHIDTSLYTTMNEPLLTNEALAGNPASFDFSPEFVNTEASSTAQTYNVSVRVDGVDKVVQWDVFKNGETWLVDGQDVLTEVSLNPSMPHVINGLPIAPQTAMVLALPGTYQVTSGLTLLNYDPAAANFTLHTGGRANFQSTLQVAEGVLEAVQGQVRDKLNACVAERSQPTACGWPLAFNNGDALDGTITWSLEPADPAAALTLPTDWTADNGFVSSTSIDYVTISSGEGTLWDGSGTGTFENERDSRYSYIEINLAGDVPVVTVS